MDHYQDIRVRVDEENGEAVLLAQVFMHLHQVLMRAANGRIGISFPNVKRTLGDRIRLHGTLDDLSSLQQSGWNKCLTDYIACSAIDPIPPGAAWRTVRRVQVKSSAERLRRRSVNKGWLSEAEAAERISVLNEQRSNLPFLQIKSGSNGQAWRLFIEHGPLVSAPSDGGFSSYGLSATTTVPWF
ncbi:type I-F CRISPR-associated endoribonuclease Cas6/Csy4 [Erwinia pyrifoliae]|uniref:type I-F CRISPR-associated endoribonuclease Cas6/Csy4 n=1 Tax=Erwinia pyrifoliae TaxID=79967 RepID=UPI00223A895C|nr:type I-F CRISPR-associated endoribonuclease Cas6/Csy4 [Erwinia pyrifoliae]MCT2387890.1 type I-F CRISPR-associated endoribonuclease Cas6/Csy4 [Erwinia pyrifoliae]MCU8586146.1 type I-F CRISPR-associated endoribonuclease Cas6/Csy4 [Erwinia pyrifoliae]